MLNWEFVSSGLQELACDGYVLGGDMVLSIPNTVARCRGRRRRRGLPRAAGRRVAVRGWRSGRGMTRSASSRGDVADDEPAGTRGDDVGLQPAQPPGSPSRLRFQSLHRFHGSRPDSERLGTPLPHLPFCWAHEKDSLSPRGRVFTLRRLPAVSAGTRSGEAASRNVPAPCIVAAGLPAARSGRPQRMSRWYA